MWFRIPIGVIQPLINFALDHPFFFELNRCSTVSLVLASTYIVYAHRLHLKMFTTLKLNDEDGHVRPSKRLKLADVSPRGGT